MADKNVLEFYKIVRTSPEMWQDLAAAEDTETVIAKITALSAAHGIPLSSDDVRAALADLPNVIAAALDTDELNDDELELVAAGTHSPCKLQDV